MLFISCNVPGEGTLSRASRGSLLRRILSTTGIGITLFPVSTEIAPDSYPAIGRHREAVVYLSGRFFNRLGIASLPCKVLEKSPLRT